MKIMTFVKITDQAAFIFKLMHQMIFCFIARAPLISLALLLTGLGLPAHARWETIGLYAQGTFYIDLDSVVREPGKRKLSSSVDYRSPQTNSQGKQYLSTRSLLHIDCTAELARTLHLSFFAGPMLKGAVVESEGILLDWQPIPSGTPMYRIMHRVC
jgi:hypothetical protein